MDPEMGSEASKPRVVIPAAEAAAAKIWAVYIAEAEKYDKALVESWKSDMEGMLIFAGLFSASLTAFLIESYKTLNPDQGDTTIRLLAQISDQLAASASGTAFHIQPAGAFTPSTSALVCNTLWFLSLGLSLTCALVATLLEQWARDLIHRSEIHSAPLIRARIFSFLYYGVKRFSMHTVVEIIPLLLHTSLFLFFAGLVAFLVPVNIAMAVLAGVILTIVAGVYSLLTVLPLRHLDSPYRTPLSGAFWRILQRIHQYWHHQQDTPAVESETIMEAISKEATEESEARVERDYRALLWTVKSLSDETELEPFVEALPDILWQPYAPRNQHNPYADQIQRFVNHPDVLLFSRITGLRDSCEMQLLSPEANQHRRITAYKALWMLAVLSDLHDTPSQGLTMFQSVYEVDNEIRHFSVSTSALVRSRHFEVLKPSLQKIQAQLSQLPASDSQLMGHLNMTITFFRDHAHVWQEYASTDPLLDIFNADPGPLLIPPVLEYVNDLLHTGADFVRLRYIQQACTLDSPPYRWNETLHVLNVTRVGIPINHINHNLQAGIVKFVAHQLEEFNTKELQWMDQLLTEGLMPLLPLEWPPTYMIVFAFIRFLAHRKSEWAIRNWAFRVEASGQLDNIWDGLVHVATSAESDLAPTPDKEETLRAVWCLASLMASMRGVSGRSVDVVHRVADIAPLSNATSVAVLLKVHHLMSYRGKLTVTFAPTAIRDLFSGETASEIQEIQDMFPARTEPPDPLMLAHAAEARMVLVCEFMEAVVGSREPVYEAPQTLTLVASYYPDAVDETHQLRFANAIANLFAHEMHANVRASLMHSLLFRVYEGPGGAQKPWLNHTPARKKIQETFTTYAQSISTVDSEIGELALVNKILRGFNRAHLPGAEADEEMIRQGDQHSASISTQV